MARPGAHLAILDTGHMDRVAGAGIGMAALLGGSAHRLLQAHIITLGGGQGLRPCLGVAQANHAKHVKCLGCRTFVTLHPVIERNHIGSDQTGLKLQLAQFAAHQRPAQSEAPFRALRIGLFGPMHTLARCQRDLAHPVRLPRPGGLAIGLSLDIYNALAPGAFHSFGFHCFACSVYISLKKMVAMAAAVNLRTGSVKPITATPCRGAPDECRCRAIPMRGSLCREIWQCAPPHIGFRARPASRIRAWQA